MATFTQAQLDALAASMSEGLLTIEYDGRRKTFQSFSEMMKLYNFMKADLEGDAHGRIDFTNAIFSRE
jgi:hypothetical protein